MSLIIKANNIYLEYFGREILNIKELEVYSYDRIGLVGDNGAGKSSLLKVLTGEYILPYSAIERYGEYAYIPQLEDIQASSTDNYEMHSRLGILNIDESTMSGGEETRSKIADALSKQVHIILADEPTCHLDHAGIQLLIHRLKAFEGALLLISHDRYFLDETVNKIWELKNGKITEYWGGYSDYLKQKEEAHAQKLLEYEQARKEQVRLENAILEKRQHALQIDSKQKRQKAKKANESAGRLGHQKTTGSKQKKLYQATKHMEKRKASLGEIHPPEEIRSIRFRQSAVLELHNPFPVFAEDLCVQFGDKILFEHAKFNIPLGAKVALTGGNGTGKTTLFKMIANRAEGIFLSPKAEIGYFAQTGYKFTTQQSVLSFMQENCEYSVGEIRAVLASMGFEANDIKKELCILSGGEMIKLLLTQMLLGKYNILLMDEPGNYLDLKGIAALETMMKNYTGTIFFTSHDRKLVENVADIVLAINDKQIVTISGPCPS